MADINALLDEVDRLDGEATPGPWDLPIRDANVSPAQHKVNIKLTERFRTIAPLLAAEVRRLTRSDHVAARWERWARRWHEEKIDLLHERKALREALAAERKRREECEAKAAQYERDWYDAKSEFGTAMATMRERLREAEGKACTEREAAVCWLWDRAEQYNAGSGIVSALEERAREILDGEHAAAMTHGELDDLHERYRRCTTVAKHKGTP